MRSNQELARGLRGVKEKRTGREMVPPLTGSKRPRGLPSWVLDESFAQNAASKTGWDLG